MTEWYLFKALIYRRIGMGLRAAGFRRWAMQMYLRADAALDMAFNVTRTDMSQWEGDEIK